MNLLDAYNLLVEDGIADNHRYFAETYKLFGFNDTHTLKKYLDFILIDPLSWLKGFPVKLNTKTTYCKPKTAMIKLLKKDEVKKSLGEDFVTNVYNTVWNIYKKHHEEILTARSKLAVAAPQGQQGQQGQPTILQQMEEDVGSVASSESFEVQPVPPLRNHVPRIQIPPADAAVSIDESMEPVLDDNQRIAILKKALLEMAGTLPAGADEAFRTLVHAI
jgi:hypothetical protein